MGISVDSVFLACAGMGGVLLVTQLLVRFIGGIEADGADFDTAHPDADASFKALSLQGLTAFFTMFGLVGLALHVQSSMPIPVSVGGGVIAGAGTTWLMARIFNLALRAQSTGTLNLSRAIGATGTVYLGITRDKPGKVNVTVAGRLLTADATTEQNENLPTGTAVRVVKVVGANTLVVERA